MTDLELHRPEPQDAATRRGRRGLASLFLLISGLPLSTVGALLQKNEIDAIADERKHRTFTLSMETAMGEGFAELALTMIYYVGVGLALGGGLLFLIGVCLPGRLRYLHILFLVGLVATMFFLDRAHQTAIAS